MESAAALPKHPVKTIAVIGTLSLSMILFRGPLLKALADTGMHVYAFATDYDTAAEDTLRALGVTPIRYTMDRTGTRPLADLRSTGQLACLLRKHHIDLVLSYFMKPVVYGSVAATLAGTKHRYAMLPGLGYAFPVVDPAQTRKRRLLGAVLASMLRFSLSLNCKLFVYTRDDENDICQLHLIHKQKIRRVSGTGIDLNAYPTAPPVLTPVTFLLAARLLREKGICEYAKAALAVKTRYPATRFVIVGGLDTNPGALAEPQVQSWVAQGILEWPGQVADVRPWLRETSVFVLPSYYREGVPRSIQEAMAMGRAIITTDSVGCRETVVEGENGFLVPVRDPQALATAMERFIEQPGLITTMGKRSRRLAEEKFDVDKINAVLLKEMGLTGHG